MYVIIQWLLRADVERTSLLADEALLTSFLHHDKPLSELPEELAGVNLEVALAECFERMETAGADNIDGVLNLFVNVTDQIVAYFLSGVATAEARATKILTGLGFDEGMILSTPTQALSGGWAMRAALAAALFVTPDLLLLDEVRCVVTDAI
jgi:ATPase subunit of ABC transporter with duplicated ATPase domains